MVLEVGIDRGTTLVPLVVFLARTQPSFTIVGIDIQVQESVQLMLMNMDLQPTQRVYFDQSNSLESLPKMVGHGMKFDVVLIDGDHNYHTVSRELQHLEALTHTGSLVIIDDYSGRWADKDLWYAERDGYQGIKQATRRVDTKKHGVRPAVDEWLETHSAWQKAQPIPGEPVILFQKANYVPGV